MCKKEEKKNCNLPLSQLKLEKQIIIKGFHTQKNKNISTTKQDSEKFCFLLIKSLFFVFFFFV